MSRLSLAIFALLATTFAANAQEGRSIALILDASGSMNAKLRPARPASRRPRPRSAHSSASSIPTCASRYRVYGHQSPTREKNCKDTELMVGFGAASANRDAILAKTEA